MTEDTTPQAGQAAGPGDEMWQGLLHRSIRNTLILGLVASLVLWKAAGWRDAGMMATGAAISLASLYEWRRLIRIIVAKMDTDQLPRGAMLATLFFLFRLVIFAAAIYGSLKWIQGSAVALLCGLALAVAAIGWEAIRMLQQ